MQTELIGAIYVRASSEKQGAKEMSLPAQVRELRAAAERDGVNIVKVFEENTSGTSLAKRPVMQECLAWLERRKGDVDALYTWSADRVARSVDDARFIRSALRRLGVRLVTLTQPETGEESVDIVTTSMFDAMAHSYSLKLAKDVRRGLRQALSTGLWPWSDKTPYGYRRVEERNGRGALRFRLEVREDQAAVVRYIFDLYLSGLGFKAIAARLTSEGIAPPERSDVAKTRLVGCWRAKHMQRILGGNPIYYGSIDFEGDLFPIVEGIVSKETWDRARALAGVRLRKKSVEATFGTGKVSDHGVLRPWMKCALCDGPMSVVRGGHEGHRHFYYACRTRQENKSACPGVTCRTDVLDEVVLARIERDVLSPAKVRRMIEDTLARMVEDAGGEVRQRRTVLEGRIKELDRKIRAISMQVVEEVIEAADAKALTGPMIAERDAARTELANLPEPEAVPSIEEIDVDAFRGEIIRHYRANEVGIRRTALDRFITEIRLSPGKARLTYSYKLAGPTGSEPYQEPPGPP